MNQSNDMNQSRADELEKQGFDYLQQHNWRDARECFEEMLMIPISPLRQVKVLRNIMGTFIKEEMNDEAIGTGEKAISIIDNYNLPFESDEGARIRGNIRAHLDMLRGKHRFEMVIENTMSLLTSIAVMVIGNTVGAFMGAQIAQKIGLINVEYVWAEPRYIGAVLGGVIGWLVLLTPLFSIVAAFGSELIFLTASLNVFVLYITLVEKESFIGFSVFIIALAPSIFAFGNAFFHVIKTMMNNESNSDWERDAIKLARRGVYGLFAAYSAGAAIGATLGSQIQHTDYTLLGDLRYGGAFLGTFFGTFLFLRIAVTAGPTISLICGIVCATLTMYILLQNNIFLGVMILACLVPFFMLTKSIIRFRIKNQ